MYNVRKYWRKTGLLEFSVLSTLHQGAYLQMLGRSVLPLCSSPAALLTATVHITFWSSVLYPRGVHSDTDLQAGISQTISHRRTCKQCHVYIRIDFFFDFWSRKKRSICLLRIREVPSSFLGWVTCYKHESVSWHFSVLLGECWDRT